jgi:hypothetical protein
MTEARNAIGKATERRFLRESQAMREKGKFPSWLSFFCAATAEEDANGVDAWAYTDVGKIPVQIKSDAKYRNKHMRRANRKEIPCVVIPPHIAFEEIFPNVIAILDLERNRRLALTAAKP